MVPESAATIGNASRKTLRVIATTEGPPGSWLAQAFVLETLSQARISDAMFAQALTDTLGRSGLFASVTGEGKAGYELRATLFQQHASTLGLSSTSARIGVRYALVDMDSARVVWRDTIYTEASSALGLSSIAMESEANERAMKANLAQLVDALSRLNLARTEAK